MGACVSAKADITNGEQINVSANPKQNFINADIERLTGAQLSTV
jgi:hypothetical protein